MPVRTVTVNGKGYNDGPYDPVDNPYGLASGGHRQDNNLINMLLDVLAEASASLQDTSTTSLTIGLGAIGPITLANNRPIPEGAQIFIIDTDTPANWMYGEVTDHTGAAITVNVTVKQGSGTDNAWTIQPAGPQGAAGEEEWNAPVDVASSASPSAPYAAVHKDLLFIDLSAGEVEVDLPSPAEGVRTRVKLVWAGGNPAANNLRITPASGDKVFGQTANDTIVIDVAFKEITLHARALGSSPETYDWR